MRAADNVATIHEIYDAFGRGDAATILGKLADHVDWATDAATGDAPWWGGGRGKDELLGFFTGIGRSTEVDKFDVVSIAATDDEVLTLIDYGFTGRESGASATMNLHHYFRFDDAGKI